MNKSHTVVWSHARNCFVVASENAKAKGKPSSTKKAMAAAIATLFLSPGISSAIPLCPGVNLITGTLTAKQCYFSDANITVAAGASVAVADDSAVLVDVDYTSQFSNSGSLTGALLLSDVQSNIGMLHVVNSTADHAGFLFTGMLDGALTNTATGLITGKLNQQAGATSYDSAYAYAYAYNGNGNISSVSGVALSTIEANGTFANAGQIKGVSVLGVQAHASTTSTADATDAYAYSYAYSGRTYTSGLLISNGLNGALINSNLISGEASTTATGMAEVNHGGFTGGQGIADSTVRADAIAYGIVIQNGGSADASFNNTGTIRGIANATASNIASVGADFDYAKAYAGTEAYSSAYGLSVSNPIGAGIAFDNRGTISANAQSAGTSNASTPVNNSNIEARTNAYAIAYGARIGGIADASVTNFGAINASALGNGFATASGTSDEVEASAQGGATAFGLRLKSYYDGTYNVALAGAFTNAGSLTATATGIGKAIAGSSSALDSANVASNAVGSAYSTAYGAYLSNYFGAGAAFENTGTIKATSSSQSLLSTATASVSGDYAYAYAYGGGRGHSRAGGISITGGLLDTATLVNRGIINTSATTNVSAVSNASASSALSTAHAMTETRAYSNAYGINVGTGGLATDATIENIGTINVNARSNAVSTATATGAASNAEAYAYAYAYAKGVNVRGGLAADAAILNSGLITAVATATASANAVDIAQAETYARAYGMIFNGPLQAGSLLQNTGSIIATANADDAVAYGVKINSDLNGSLINSGTIAGVGTTLADSYSLYINSGSGTVENQAGGLLFGNLHTGGSVAVNNAGTIALPSGASAYIAGDYAQSSTGTLKLGASSVSSYATLNVGGTATLDGKAFVNVQGLNGLAVGDVLTSVVSANTLAGSFTSVVDNSLLLNFVASNNGNAVDIAVTKGTSATEAAQKEGNNPAGGAARVFDGILGGATASAPQMEAAITALSQLGTEKEVSDALSQTLPSIQEGLTSAKSGFQRGLSRIVQSRQDSQSGQASGDEFFGNKNVWFKPFGSWASQDNHKGVTGFDADAYGMVFGADAELNDSGRVGLAFAYAHTNIDGNLSAAPQHGDVDSYQLLAYGKRNLAADMAVTYEAGFGIHKNEGSRRISLTNQTARSNYDSWSVHLGAGLEKTLALNERTSFTPSIRADFTHFDDDGYSEKGASGLNLDVDSNKTEELVLSVDGKVTHALNQKTKLTADFGIGYDLINDRSSISSSFAGAPSASFTTKGIDPSPWLARGGFGIIGNPSELVEVTARYDFEVRDNYDNQTVSVKVNWKF